MMELSSDPETYEKKLIEVEDNIKEIDPSFNPQYDDPQTLLKNKYLHGDRVFIGTDIVRSTEALFKPHLIGIN